MWKMSPVKQKILPLTEEVSSLINPTIQMLTTQTFSWDFNFKDQNARLIFPPKNTILIHGANKAVGNGQQAILNTCTEKENKDDSCAKEQLLITYGSVIWTPCQMENTGPKYPAMDSVQEGQRRKCSVCTNSRRGIFSFLWQLCFPLRSVLAPPPPHPPHSSAGAPGNPAPTPGVIFMMIITPRIILTW